ncbi:Uracil DNA glycosylase superfamily protein [Nonomuraea coxensis DSM 45129]|uniref:Uracil DNA glycosylase superfamily protein n=1 Tax=Nonomuraea coxensis DSM 45129 TaxID=1122611 RepID=A0ABX8TT66_9ACTN|nr:Uracil DNA glycosylase superfamily protein [Nonomuraea coxensis DSM 45129]
MLKDGNNGAADFLPERHDLVSLRDAAARCEGCGLYRDATQTVFGEGKGKAAFMLVGEQPGDQEDRQGHPFVGPAGRGWRPSWRPWSRAWSWCSARRRRARCSGPRSG